MTVLHVLRHAKSDWGDASLDDAARPLARRGRRDAASLRDHFARQRLAVGLVLVSPARRARETWDAVAAGVAASVVRIEPAVYGASGGALLDVLRMTGDDVEAVMIVGHNPGCESLVEILTGSSDGFPTCTVASVRLDGRWTDATQGSGQLLSFVRARDLT